MMTLKRQVVLAGALIFALALLGVAAGQWLSGREFVREQLAAHANETATALAFSLSNSLRDGDAVMVKTMLLPIFDRGYYRRIVIRDVAGSVVEALEPEAAASAVPRWFAMLARLEAPQARALVNAGWQQVGLVEVEGDVEFALRQLWNGTLRSLAWLSAVYAAAMTLMFAWLRRLLAPMAAVERIAAAAAVRQIVPIALQTRVRELASFIVGFNRLAGMVNARLAEEEARAERFRAAALIDRVTGLANRLGLEVALADALPGWLGIVSAEGLSEVNRANGYAAGDAFVVTLAKSLKEAFPDAVLARLNAATFAIAMESGEAEDLRRTTRQLLAAMKDHAAGYDIAHPRVAAGWVPIVPGEPLSALLAAADLALAAAPAEASDSVLIRRAGQVTGDASGTQALMRWVVDAIDGGKHSLSWQTVVSVPEGHLVQTEVYLRVRGPEGQLIPAQRFIPLFQRERRADLLDRAMLGRLRQCIALGEIAPGPLAANIAADTFATGRLQEWLLTIIDGWPAAYPLILELREFDAVAAPEAAESFATALRARNVGLALDHFGMHAGGIAALRRLLPQYVKLDASLSHGLEAVERRFQVEALVRAAHSLEVPVWAQVFDSSGALELLAEMGIVGAQGFALAAEREQVNPLL